MADKLHAQSLGVTAAPTQHPIQLHATASNSLQRCLRALNGDVVDYRLAEQHLSAAAHALKMLSGIVSDNGEVASC